MPPHPLVATEGMAHVGPFQSKRCCSIVYYPNPRKGFCFAFRKIFFINSSTFMRFYLWPSIAYLLDIEIQYRREREPTISLCKGDGFEFMVIFHILLQFIAVLMIFWNV